METRRENLKILGAISATCAFPFSADELFGQDHVHPAPEKIEFPGPFKPKFFAPDEIKLISRIADLIIPETDTPGASAAGVPQYIDSVVAGNPAMQLELRGGLSMFGTDFLSKQKSNRSRFSSRSALKPMPAARPKAAWLNCSPRSRI